MFFLMFFSITKISAQEGEGEQSILLGRAEYGSSDKFSFSLTGTTMSWAGDLRYTERLNLSELYLGPVVSKWRNDKVRFAVTPGMAFCDSKNQFLYGLKVIYKKAETKRVEKFINGGFLLNINKDRRSIFFFDGEILRSFKNFKIGVGFGAEKSKEIESEGMEKRIIKDNRFHLEARFLVPIRGTHFSIIGFSGFVYRHEPEYHSNFNLNIDIGVRYELF